MNHFGRYNTLTALSHGGAWHSTICRESYIANKTNQFKEKTEKYDSRSRMFTVLVIEKAVEKNEEVFSNRTSLYI